MINPMIGLMSGKRPPQRIRDLTHSSDLFLSLCEAMRRRYPVRLLANNGIEYVGIVCGLRPEDGSGNCWLVMVLNEKTNIRDEVFVRTRSGS